jgi:creatinine amidohydrolase
MSTLLADLTWQDAEQRRDAAVLAIPIGATEQHGPHLPLSTDTDIAFALAHALSRERPVIVAPTVAFGSSGEHAGFAGTLSIGVEATVLLLVELARSASATFPRTLLVCAHGGNLQCVGDAETRLREEGRDVRAFFPSWSGDAHAGRSETSLMLALAPQRVQLERAAAGVTSPLPEILPRLVADGVRAVSANGVLGDPTGASASEGHALLRKATAELTAFLDAWCK